MSLDSGKMIHGNKWTHMNVTDDVINKVHLLADNDGLPWIHDDPFTINFEQNNLENDLYQVGEVINEIEVSSTADNNDVDGPTGKVEENQEIEERAKAAIDQLNDASTIIEKNSENNMLIDEYSSDTTIEALDSTYRPDGDVLEENEVSSNVPTVDSGDFFVNIANIYSDESQSIIEGEETNEDQEIISNTFSDSNLDIPITELINTKNK